MTVPQALIDPRGRHGAYPGLPRGGRTNALRRVRDGELIADVAYWSLRLLGWVSINLLVVLGTTVVLFAMMANLEIEAFCLHVQGLASHYLSAAPDARASFSNIVGIGLAIAFSAVSAFRFRALTPARQAASSRETING